MPPPGDTHVGGDRTLVLAADDLRKRHLRTASALIAVATYLLCAAMGALWLVTSALAPDIAPVGVPMGLASSAVAVPLARRLPSAGVGRAVGIGLVAMTVCVISLAIWVWVINYG
jgi:hypothetical protein